MRSSERRLARGLGNELGGSALQRNGRLDGRHVVVKEEVVGAGRLREGVHVVAGRRHSIGRGRRRPFRLEHDGVGWGER